MSVDYIIKIKPTAAFRTIGPGLITIGDTGFGLNPHNFSDDDQLPKLHANDGSEPLPLELMERGLIAMKDFEPVSLQKLKKTHDIDRALTEWGDLINVALDEPMRKHMHAPLVEDAIVDTPVFASGNPPPVPPRGWLFGPKRAAMRTWRKQIQEHCHRHLTKHKPAAKRPALDTPADPLRDESWSTRLQRLVEAVPWNEPMEIYCGMADGRLLMAITGLHPDFPGPITAKLKTSSLKFSEAQSLRLRQRQYLATALITVTEIAYRVADFSHVEAVATYGSEPAARLSVPEQAREIDLPRLALRWPDEGQGLGKMLQFDPF